MKTIILSLLYLACFFQTVCAESIKIGSGIVEVKLEKLTADEAEIVLKKIFYGRYFFSDTRTEKLAKGLTVARNDQNAEFLFLRIPNGARISKNEKRKEIVISWPISKLSYSEILISYDSSTSLQEKLNIQAIGGTII